MPRWRANGPTTFMPRLAARFPFLTAVSLSQEQNATKAKEELAYAEERYKVGLATFLDVTTSRGTYEQALIDRVNAVYDYHKAFAALENAVGRPLR